MLSNFLGDKMTRKELRECKNLHKSVKKPCQMRSLLKNSSCDMVTFYKQKQNNNNNNNQYSNNDHIRSQKSILFGNKKTKSQKSLLGHQPMSINGKMNGKLVVKQANAYFKHHPTCFLRESTNSDSDQDSSRLSKNNSNKSLKVAKEVDYRIRLNMIAEGANLVEQKPRKYVTKNPYYEDTDTYNLEACITEKRKPTFGYAQFSLSDNGLKESAVKIDGMDDVAQIQKSFDFDLLKPQVVARQREKLIMDHVLKCFTFGRPVRRDSPLERQEVSNIDEIKALFSRVHLIRHNFKVQRRNVNRKFDNPVDQFGHIIERNDQVDFQQYCIESDFEHEYPRRNKAFEKHWKREVQELKKRQLGLNLSTMNGEMVTTPSFQKEMGRLAIGANVISARNTNMDLKIFEDYRLGRKRDGVTSQPNIDEQSRILPSSNLSIKQGKSATYDKLNEQRKSVDI